ncbi:MAG: TolC family protein [Paucibacter sp.]|nr:TolC family protein [Roseateles sp.]
MIRSAFVVASSLVLVSCATFSSDGGMNRVSRLTEERSGHAVTYQRDDQDAAAAQARVAELLGAPLSADAAVELALLNNRSLQAQLGNLGIAGAELVRAGRLRNPLVSLGRVAGGGALEIDRSVMFDLLGLLTLPARTKLAEQRFERAQYQAAGEAVATAAQAREAFFDAVAAAQLATYAQQVKEAADATSELARGMAQAGNLSRLDQMREQAFYADASADLTRAQQQALAARERLLRALGLGDRPSALLLPERLPDLPEQPSRIMDAEQAALDQRLDVQMARRETEALALELGLTRATAFVDDINAGWQSKSQHGSPPERGAEVQFSIPLFDFGGAARAQAKAQYLQSVNRTAAIANNARSQLRESDAAYRNAYELARRYRDEVVPLRKRISDETLLRYNGMLIDVFQLLADAREQVASVTASVKASRDYWLAESRMQSALAGAVSASGSPSPPNP